jgi:hypothetical protein
MRRAVRSLSRGRAASIARSIQPAPTGATLPGLNERSVRLVVDMLNAAEHVERMPREEISAMLRQAAALLVQGSGTPAARRNATDPGDEAKSAATGSDPATTAHPVSPEAFGPRTDRQAEAAAAPPAPASSVKGAHEIAAQDASVAASDMALREALLQRISGRSRDADAQPHVAAAASGAAKPDELSRREPIATTQLRPSDALRNRFDSWLQSDSPLPDPAIVPKPEAPKRKPAVPPMTAAEKPASPRLGFRPSIAAFQRRPAVVLPGADAWLDGPARREPIVGFDLPPPERPQRRFNWPLFALAFAIGFVTLISTTLLIGRGTATADGHPIWGGDDWLTITLAGFVAVQIVFGLVALPMLRPLLRRWIEAGGGD